MSKVSKIKEDLSYCHLNLIYKVKFIKTSFDTNINPHIYTWTYIMDKSLRDHSKRGSKMKEEVYIR